MKLELQRVRVAVSGARDARRSWNERESVRLSCTDATGTRGVGEASPLPGYSRDTLDDVEAALRALDAAAVASALEQRSVLGALSALSALLPSELPAARMALETAALDWLGQSRQLSAPALLGAPAGATRRLAALLGPAGSDNLLRDAERARLAGFEHFKLKLGEPGRLAAEVEAIAQLREQLGTEVGLRLDANGALSAAELERAWPALAPLDIELFEEPGAEPEALSGRLPLALDESLQGLSVEDAMAALKSRRARAVVLKPMALGGIAHCWRLAELAMKAGASVVVSHCFDGPHAWRAAAALALALPAGAAHGLAPHAALMAWQPAPLPVRRGALASWTNPGLGT